MMRCTLCLLVKPLEGFYIRRANNKPISRCKECQIKIATAWAKANPELNSAKKRLNYQRHPERNLKLSAKWGKENVVKRREICSAYRARHKDQCRIASTQASKISVRELDDKYVKTTITLATPFLNRRDISHKLVDAKRAYLKVYRLIKEMRK